MKQQPEDLDALIALTAERNADLERVKSCYEVHGIRRVERLLDPRLSARGIEDVLVSEGGLERGRAHDIAFHLTDWIRDAAFLVALHLYPERFEPRAAVAGIATLLAHAPNHLAAGAELFGVPVGDVFEVGVCKGRKDG